MCTCGGIGCSNRVETMLTSCKLMSQFKGGFLYMVYKCITKMYISVLY